MPLFATYNNVTYTVSIDPEGPIEYGLDDIHANKGQFGAPYIRPTVTRVLRVARLRYRYLPEADKVIFDALFTATNYSDIFLWRDPVMGANKNVHLGEMPKCAYVGGGYYDLDLAVKEV